jgi:tetratricopeptide (TPR) repeat protein
MLSSRCFLLVGLWSLFALRAAAQVPESAGELWQKGQAAMRAGQPEKAILYYQQSLQADPSFTRNHLSLAAAYLDAGKDEAACDHLARYVAAHPEQTFVRTQYAELLLKLKHTEAAREELLHLIADCQEVGDETLPVRLHCHSRLLDIAQEQEDDYAAHLHRGVGLYLLARQRADLDDPEGELPVEGLLCRAAAELTLARALRPGEAQPLWYLHAVWSQLGRSDAARRCLALAAAAAPFSDLTPAEQRSLALACRAGEASRLRK